MSFANGSLWINKEFKGEYSDSSLNGLRLFFKGDIDESDRKYIYKFISFLRKKYFFPIRCKIFFCNQKNFLSFNRKDKCKGIFLQGDIEKKVYPSIYVSSKISKNWDKNDILLSICRLLTYYFQWYFYEDENRSSRSLEIEATKYAYYLVYEFLDLYN